MTVANGFTMYPDGSSAFDNPAQVPVSADLSPDIERWLGNLQQSLGVERFNEVVRGTPLHFLYATVNRQWYPPRALDDTGCIRHKCVDGGVLDAMPGGKQVEGNPSERVPVVLFQIPRFTSGVSYIVAAPEDVERQRNLLMLNMVDPHVHMGLNRGFDNPLAMSHPNLTFWRGKGGKFCYSHIQTLPNSARRVIDVDEFHGVRGVVWYAGTPKA